MTTIPYLKQYDNPITDYLKQYNKLLKQANPNVNELKNLLETFAVHEILIDKHDVTGFRPRTSRKRRRRIFIPRRPRRYASRGFNSTTIWFTRNG